jgi:hypothetical protein
MSTIAIACITALSLISGAGAPALGEAPTAAPTEPTTGMATDTATPEAAASAPSTTTTTTTTTTTPGSWDAVQVEVQVSPPPPQVVPAPVPPPPPRREPTPGATAAIALGATSLGLGVFSIVLIAGPSALVKRAAKDRAERDPIIGVSDQATRYRRARNADDTMEASFWTGVALIGVGAIALAVGIAVKKRANAARRQARLAPASAGLGFRF